MLDLRRLRTVLAIALPIVGGMASQNVLNLVDTAMVGSLGDAALAAVGMGSFANFMATAFITGLSAGVQAMAARRKGEERHDATAVALNGGLLLAAGLAIPLSMVLVTVVDELFPYLNGDPEVIEQGVPYLRARLFAMLAVGMNFSFRGYWNGVSLSRLYMGTLLVMHATNIFLNWVFIFGNLGAPALGATGAGVASAIATYVGTVVYFALGWRYARPAGFLAGIPDGPSLRTMLRLSVPAGIQQLFFAAGFTAFFWIVGQVGTPELAAANVLINVTLVAILPSLGLGLAAASLVGQALGRGEATDARRWGWEVAGLAVLVIGGIGLPMLLVPDAILGVFLSDPDTLALARTPLRIVGATIGFEASGMVLMNAMLGAGDTRRVMAASIGFQWGLGLPLAWAVGPHLGMGLTAIWLAQVSYRALQTASFVAMWRGGHWARVEV